MLTLYGVAVLLEPVTEASACESEALLAKVREPFTVPLLCGVKATLKDRLWPEASVSGKDTPCKINWELLLLAEDTVTLAPVALMVIGSVSVVPSFTLPKLTSVGARVKEPTVGFGVGVGAGLGVPPPPVPERGTVSATLETYRLPPTVPADRGAKLTFNVTLCPELRVKGNEAPLTENPLPVVLALWRVRLKGRSFLSTTGTVELAPIATEPNGTVEGLAIRDTLVVPPPRTSSTKLAFAALLENWMVPTVNPAVAVKLTFKSTLCPAARTSGRPGLETVNWGLLAAIPETVTLVCPLFVRVTIKVSV
jgi:hypothetical protein